MTQVQGSGAAPVAPFAAMLGDTVMPMLATTPVIVAVFWIVRGARGGLSALLGVCIAATFFAVGLYVMSRLTNADPRSVLVAAIAVYLGQIIFLGVVLVSFSGASWLDGKAFGLSVLAVALTWQLAQLVAFLKIRKPVYDDRGAGVPADPATGPIGERADEPVQRRLR